MASGLKPGPIDDKRITEVLTTIEQFGRYFKRSYISKARLVEIDESEYVRSHGKRPRGHGNWCFALENPLYTHLIPKSIWFTAAYNVARRRAQLAAVILGVDTIYTRS
jgi:hypothetical protein